MRDEKYNSFNIILKNYGSEQPPHEGEKMPNKVEIDQKNPKKYILHLSANKRWRVVAQCNNTVTGPPYPLAGSVERPRGGVHRRDVASEVSSVLP